MCSTNRVRRSLSACSLRTPSRITAVRWQIAAMATAASAISPHPITKSTRTSSWPTMPRSIACWIRIGTTTRPPAPIAASTQVSASPWRRIGASSNPRPIAVVAEKRPTGSVNDGVLTGAPWSGDGREASNGMAHQ